MAPSLTVDQTKSVVVGDLYRIRSEVTAAVEMEVECFVYSQATDLYDHIATMFDMQNYPTATDPSIAYYRQDFAQQDLTTPATADTVADTHLERLDELVEEFRLGGATYDGSTDTTVLNGTGV